MLAKTETEKRANGAGVDVDAATGAALPLLGPDTAARSVARLPLFTEGNKPTDQHEDGRAFEARAVRIDRARYRNARARFAH
jgi:hypothetical protein